MAVSNELVRPDTEDDFEAICRQRPNIAAEAAGAGRMPATRSCVSSTRGTLCDQTSAGRHACERQHKTPCQS